MKEQKRCRYLLLFKSQNEFWKKIDLCPKKNWEKTSFRKCKEEPSFYSNKKDSAKLLKFEKFG